MLEMNRVLTSAWYTDIVEKPKYEHDQGTAISTEYRNIAYQRGLDRPSFSTLSVLKGSEMMLDSNELRRRERGPQHRHFLVVPRVSVRKRVTWLNL